MPRAAKKRSWRVAMLLAALVTGAVPAAEASIPPPESWPSLVEEPAASVLEPPSLEDLAAEIAAAEPPPAPAAQASAGEPFRLFEGLEIGLARRSKPRFRLYPRLETRVWAITLPEPLHVELELPLTPSRFRLYGDLPAGIGVGGTFMTTDPLGYVDSPNLYQYGLNNPVNFSDPMGLEAAISQKGHFAIINPDTGKSRIISNEWAREHPSGIWFVLTEEAQVSETRAKELIEKAGVSLVPGFAPCPPGVPCMTAGPKDRGAAYDVAVRTAAIPVCGISALDNAVRRVNYGSGSEIPCAIGPPQTERQEEIDRALLMYTVIVGGTPRGGVMPRGLPSNSSFAQRTFSRTFSEEGQIILSRIAGRRIVTVDDLADAIRTGAVNPADIPVNIVVRDGNTLILNTRTVQALEQAGIPRSTFNVIDKTGDPLFEGLLSGQLQRNRLTSQGVPTVRPSGGD